MRLLTAVRPRQLMLGKITCMGLVALVQIVVVAVVALVLGAATKLVSIPILGSTSSSEASSGRHRRQSQGRSRSGLTKRLEEFSCGV